MLRRTASLPSAAVASPPLRLRHIAILRLISTRSSPATSALAVVGAWPPWRPSARAPRTARAIKQRAGVCHGRFTAVRAHTCRRMPCAHSGRVRQIVRGDRAPSDSLSWRATIPKKRSCSVAVQRSTEVVADGGSTRGLEGQLPGAEETTEAMKQQHIPVVQPVTVPESEPELQRPLYRPSQQPLY